MPNVLIRLRDAAASDIARRALENKYAVTVQTPPEPLEPAAQLAEAWIAADYRAVVLDYVATDARSVKLLQTVTDEPRAPRFLFVLPEGEELDRPLLLTTINEGAWAILPAPLNPDALATYADRAINGPGRFRHETPADGGLDTMLLEEQVRRSRAQAAAGHRLIAYLLSTPPSALDRRALVVSDSPFQREQLEKLLKEYGFRVWLAADSQAGLDLALAEKPRIVVSDYEMESFDGVEFCRRLKIENKLASCHFVVCTANPDKVAAILTPGNGVDDCVPKPSSASENLDFIARVAMGLLL